MGNTGYTNERPFRIALTKQSFTDNESISGEILIEPMKTIILSDVIIRIKLHSRWSYKSGKKSVSETYSVIIYHTLLNIGSILGVASSEKQLLPGQYFFPFTLPVINNIQPTFEYSNRIYHRYSIQAEGINSNIDLKAETMLIINRGPCILRSPLSFISNMNVYTWGMFNQGTTIFKASYPNNNYRFGDLVHLTISIDNTNGKKDVNEIKVNLKRVITLKRKGGNVRRVMKEKLFEEHYDFNVRSKESKTTNLKFRLHISNSDIPNYNRKNCRDVLSTVESRILSCNYYIKPSCDFDGFVTDSYRPSVYMPIAISYQVANNNLNKTEENVMGDSVPPLPIDVNNAQI